VVAVHENGGPDISGTADFLAIADLDGDGAPELLAEVAERPADGDPAPRVVVWRATATRLEPYESESESEDESGEDFDGDGRPDLATLDETGSAALRRGTGGGAFAPPEAVAVRLGAVQVLAGDFDRDGHVDLLHTPNAPFEEHVAAGEIVELYRRLVSCPGHVGAALNMMANWDLLALQGDLSHLKTPLYLVVGDRDWTVPPTDAQRVRQLLPQAEIITLPRLGHLAHEERPREVASLIGRLARAEGILSG